MLGLLRHPVRFPRDHRFTLAHASDYLDGDLDAAGRERVERHAGLCPKCRELLESLGRTVAALRELGSPRAAAPAAAGVAPGIVARLRADRSSPG